jgi:hypothetical protein
MLLLWPIFGRHRDRAFFGASVSGALGPLMMTSAKHMRSTQLDGRKTAARAPWPELPACMLLCVLLWSPASAQIRPVQEDGRTVFVNDGTVASKSVASNSAVQPAESNSPPLQYWSNTEHRWKPLPHASSSQFRRARVAAAEVQSVVQARPVEKSVPEKSSAASRSHDSNSVEIDRIIEEAAARHHVDANLVRAVIKVESNFNPAAVSRKGAMGLMQLMPATARKFNLSNPFDARQNVDAGVRQLKRLLDNFGGDVGLTLAAYNAGEAAVNRNNGVPPYPETRQYVRQIRGLYGGEMSTLISSAPIRVSRNAFGVLTFTNVE